MTSNNPFDGDFKDLFDFLKQFEDLPGGRRKVTLKSKITTHTLRGDSIRLEQIDIGNGTAMKLYFPKGRVATIPDGTKGQAIRYDSPADNSKRIIYAAYINGRYRIEMPKK